MHAPCQIKKYEDQKNKNAEHYLCGNLFQRKAMVRSGRRQRDGQKVVEDRGSLPGRVYVHGEWEPWLGLVWVWVWVVLFIAFLRKSRIK